MLAAAIVTATGGAASSPPPHPAIDEPLSVLALYELDASAPASVELGLGISAAMSRDEPQLKTIYSEHLDLARFSSPEHISEVRDFLVQKYSEIRPDVIFAAGPETLRFALAYRHEFAPRVPVVFGAIRAEFAEEFDLPADVTGVVGSFDLHQTVALARDLQPDADRLVILSGSAPFDRSWEQRARAELTEGIDGLALSFVSGLTFEALVETVKSLDERTILIILTVFWDSRGPQGRPHEVASYLARESAAPAYSVYSTYMGRGFVGGYVESFEVMGEAMVDLALQMSRDEPSRTPIVEVEGNNVVDWRQLRRFGISERRVPRGSQLLFYDPTIWQRYRLELLIILAVIIGQSLTIAALVVAERRRRLVVQQLAEGRIELAHLSRTAQLGVLSGALAHELNQPLTSILANAEAGRMLIEAGPENLEEISEILKDIALDDRRAAAIISHLRRLMLRGDTELDLIDLSTVAAATLAIARSELVVRGTHVDFQSSGSGIMVRGNLPQLQQILLNLMLNAIDAMETLPLSQRRIVVEIGIRKDGWRDLAVRDYGPGISEEIRSLAFKPFVSTKQNGLGFGLSICRSIARAHHGTLAFDESVATGARVVLSLPPP